MWRGLHLSTSPRLLARPRRLTNLVLIVQPPSGTPIEKIVTPCGAPTLGASCAREVLGLTPGTTYSVTVAAINSIDRSDASAALSVATCAEEPDGGAAAGASGPPQFAARSSNSITLSWSATSGTNGAPIQRYRVVYYASTDVNTTASAETSDGSATSLEVGGLLAGVGYRFAVQAYNGVFLRNGGTCPPAAVASGEADGWSPLSADSTCSDSEPDSRCVANFIYPVATPPETPAQVVAVPNEVQSKQMQLRWAAPFGRGAPVSSYTLYTGDAMGCDVLNVTLPAQPCVGQCTSSGCVGTRCAHALHARPFALQ